MATKTETIAKWKMLHKIINILRSNYGMPLTKDKYPDYDEFGNKVL